MKLLFISGDTALAQGKKGPFYYLLEEFSKYWERVDIICPYISTKSRYHRDGQTFQPIQPFNNVFIYSSPWPIWLQPWFILKKGLEIYKREKFDIFGIHSYPSFYNDIGGLWLHKKIKSPYVLEVMHITGYPKAGDFKEWFYRILTKLFIRFFAKNAKAIRVINQKQVPDFLIKSGINSEKIKYVPAFYIDFNIFEPQNREKKYDIVFSGRLVKNKGIKLLLEAIKKVKTQIPNVKSIIIGVGPLENKIKKYIKKNGLQNNIILGGWLSGTEELAKIYNQSKILVMPSFNEGGPRVTLEAMACKVAVITSKVGIMLDIIQDKKNGLFIDWEIEDIANKILLLLKDGDLRKKIAENGYRLAQQFERKKAIKNYAEAYQNLLHSTRI